jgi:hypothetical protein
MSSISATLSPSPDGSIHLPIPSELRGKSSLRVVAWIEPVVETLEKTGAGAWAVQACGIAKPLPHESSDEARLASLRKKFVGR